MTEVRTGGDVVDRYETRFGIRSIKVDAQKGLLLNGKPVKVKGTCNHQDHAGLGAALPDAVQSFRMRKLQEMGCNGLRTSHNPPTPELLDACDELGMLVFDETRMMSSNPEGSASSRIWFAATAIIPASSCGRWATRKARQTRTGRADFHGDEGCSHEARWLTPGFDRAHGRHRHGRPRGRRRCRLQLHGSGRRGIHKAHPERPVIGTETVSAVCTRGIYVTDYDKGYVGSYDPYTTTGRASAEGWWSFCDAQPWLAGGFVWTGFDYRGEPSPNGWPNIGSQYGIIDICGFPKDTFFYYKSWWTSDPVLHLFPHWNWPGMEGKVIAVWVHSNLDKVELFLNGQSQGMKEMKKDSHLAWDVAYAPGAIEARGYKGDKLVLTAKRETTGAAAALALSPIAAKSPPTAKTWPCLPWKCATRKAALCRSPTTKSHST